MVVGADATPAGWVCVVLDGERLDAAVVGPDPALIAATWPAAAVLGIDIPIGLPPDGERRRADLEARSFVGGRSSSVWLTPPRAVLVADWAPGLGVSLQAHGMRRRIFGVESTGDVRFHEVHPEVTFAHLNGRRPLASKRTWEGLQARLALLGGVGIEPPPLRVPADDLFDAAAVAWSAARVARGEARTLPADPGPGEPVIWY